MYGLIQMLDLLVPRQSEDGVLHVVYLFLEFLLLGLQDLDLVLGFARCTPLEPAAPELFRYLLVLDLQLSVGCLQAPVVDHLGTQRLVFHEYILKLLGDLLLSLLRFGQFLFQGADLVVEVDDFATGRHNELLIVSLQLRFEATVLMSELLYDSRVSRTLIVVFYLEQLGLKVHVLELQLLDSLVFQLKFLLVPLGHPLVFLLGHSGRIEFVAGHVYLLSNTTHILLHPSEFHGRLIFVLPQLSCHLEQLQRSYLLVFVAPQSQIL